MGNDATGEVKPEVEKGKDEQMLELLQGLNQKLEGLTPPKAKEADGEKSAPATLDDLLAELSRENVEEGNRGKEARPESTEAPTTVDLEKMSSTQLANYVVGYMHTQYFQPLVEQIELIRIRDEIKDAAREAKKDGEDFLEYKDSVFKVLEKRPNLSVREAYNLVRGSKPRATKEDDSSAGASKSKARSLADLGERPGVSRSTVSPSNVKTIKAAAELAWDEVMKDT